MDKFQDYYNKVVTEFSVTKNNSVINEESIATLRSNEARQIFNKFFNDPKNQLNEPDIGVATVEDLEPDMIISILTDFVATFKLEKQFKEYLNKNWKAEDLVGI